MTFTTEQLHACAVRELQRRRKVYPNQLLTGRIKPEVSERELGMMTEIVNLLAELARSERLL